MKKTAIAKIIPSLIDPNDTIFINSGSTVLQAAIELKDLPLRIITNNPMLTLLELGEKNVSCLIGGVSLEKNRIVSWEIRP